MGKTRVKRTKEEEASQDSEEEKTLVECASCGEWLELTRTPFKTKEEANATPRFDCKHCIRLTFLKEEMAQRFKQTGEEWALRIQGWEAQLSAMNEAHSMEVAKLQSQWQQEVQKREELEDQLSVLKGLVASIQYSGGLKPTAGSEGAQNPNKGGGVEDCVAEVDEEDNTPMGKSAPKDMGNTEGSDPESLGQADNRHDLTQLGMNVEEQKGSERDAPDVQSQSTGKNEEGTPTPAESQRRVKPADNQDSDEDWQSGQRKRKRRSQAQKQKQPQVQPGQQLPQTQTLTQQSQDQATPAQPVQQPQIGVNSLGVQRRALVVGDINALRLKHRALRMVNGDKRLWFYTKGHAKLREAVEKVEEELQTHKKSQHLVVLHAGQVDLLEDVDPQGEITWLKERVGRWVQQFPQNHYLLYATPTMEGNQEGAGSRGHVWNTLLQTLSRELGPQVEFVWTAGYLRDRDMEGDGYSGETAQVLGTRLGRRVRVFLGAALRQHDTLKAPRSGNPGTQQTWMAAMGKMLLQLSKRS